MTMLYCKNADCGAYLGSMGADSCSLCGHVDQDAIESAACADRDARIAELLANEKVLLAQIQGHTQWREKIIKASEQAYGESAVRYKFSLTKNGKCMNTFPKEIDGRWFALVPAEDDGHIGHVARIAELERQLVEARNQALEDAAKCCEGEQVNADATGMAEDRAYNIATKHCATAIRAMKKEQHNG